MLNTATFAAAQQAQIDALLGLSAKAFEGIEKLATLNLKTAKASLGDVAEAGVALQSAKDPQQVLALQASLLQPAADKAAAYGREVYDIVIGAKAEVEKVATAQAAKLQATLVELADAAAKNAPEGSASGVALFKSALAAANNAFDGIQKATRQVTEMTEANFAAATGAVKSAAAKGKRA